MFTIGKVYLIGAGPGDPGLITVKGLEALKKADVVIYDRLVAEELLQEAGKDAEVIYAGKSPQGHTLKQEEINQLLISKARGGERVARLKGGDPFLFGRGGEEAEALAEAGVPFEIVPGITSALAVPAYAGIPVTHREYASALAIVTGHEDPSRAKPRLPWKKLAGADTLVILMGMENLPSIVQELLDAGLPPPTPIALIRQGTGPNQETVTGTLKNILSKGEGMAPPVVVVVGKVVRLRKKLRWFDNRPLFGKRVLVTRAREQASALSCLLRDEGAEPVELPTIRLEPLPERLDGPIAHLSGYSWMVFTSPRAVEVFFQRLFARGKDSRALGGAKLAALGPATAEALRTFGLAPDLVPEDFSSQGLLQAFRQRGVAEVRFLLPRSEMADDALTAGLRSLGATVEEIKVYRPHLAPPNGKEGLELLSQGRIDIVTFTSSSTVKGLLELIKGEVALLEKPFIACIGPATAEAARRAGIRVDVVAREHTIPGLVAALREAYYGP